MNAADFRDLVAGCSEQHLADYLQLDLRTFQRYKRGQSRIPHAVTIALRLRLDGDLSAIGGKDWVGFRFGQDGKFYAPLHGRGFDPWQLQAMFFEVQEARWLRREVIRLEREAKTLRAQAWAAQALNKILNSTHRRTA